MRGEETQLLGLGTLWPGFSGVVCMPGTHSKWVQLSRPACRALHNGDDRRTVRGFAHPFRPAPFLCRSNTRCPIATTDSRPGLPPASKRPKSCQQCSSRFVQARFFLAGHPIGVLGFFRAY